MGDPIKRDLAQDGCIWLRQLVAEHGTETAGFLKLGDFSTSWVTAFRHFHGYEKRPWALVISVRLSARIKSAPIGRISLKFNVWGLYENLSRKSKFGYYPVKKKYQALYVNT
jgi:hypothetical protein